MNKIIECVPNFSEGRDLEKIDKIVAPFRGKSGVKLLDYSNDEDHNRLVVTLSASRKLCVMLLSRLLEWLWN